MKGWIEIELKNKPLSVRESHCFRVFPFNIENVLLPPDHFILFDHMKKLVWERS